MIKQCSIFCLLCAAIFGGAASLSYAQGFIEPFQGQPGCSDLINDTDYKVYGLVRTAETPMADGTPARHEATFIIPPGDKWRVCSQGPFFEGGKVELQIKTLIPVFTCKTSLGSPIYITATRKMDDSGFDWHATCY